MRYIRFVFLVDMEYLYPICSNSLGNRSHGGAHHSLYSANDDSLQAWLQIWSHYGVLILNLFRSPQQQAWRWSTPLHASSKWWQSAAPATNMESTARKLQKLFIILSMNNKDSHEELCIDKIKFSPLYYAFDLFKACVYI